MNVHKVRIFYFVCIVSFAFCLLSFMTQFNSWKQQTVKFDPVQTNKVISVEKDADLHISPRPLKATFPQFKNTIQISIDEIESLARNNIPADAFTKPKVIFLVTTWRSGSTFLGEAISSSEAVYYHYEPLTSFGFQNLDNPILTDACLQTIESLSTCQYSKLDHYMKWVQNDTFMLSLNNKISRACKFLAQDCYDVNFLSKVCTLFPIQLFKIVRLPVAVFEKFLKNNSQAHIIFLVRDPRGILASRRKLNWCLENENCSSPDFLCDTLQSNLASAKLLQNKYSQQIHLVKYESLAMNASAVLKNLFHDLDMNFSDQVSEYLKVHTSSNIEEPWSTYRISRLRINHWKDTLESSMIGHVQNKCDIFMREFNYPFINVTLCQKLC